MDPSSLVFAAIVGVWGVYLVPQWLRRRHELAQARDQDRASAAARVLAPRRRPVVASGGSSRPVLREPATEPISVAALGRVAEPARSRPAGTRPAARVAARRRARVLLVVVAGLMVSWGLVGVGVLPWVAGLPATALLALDLVGLRMAVRRRSARVAAGPATVSASSGPARRSTAAVVPPQVSGVRTAPVAPAETEVEQPAVDDGTWVPIPVPPPVYTLKPAAPRWDHFPRERPVAISDPVPAVAEEDLAPLDLDAVLQRRRAVNH